MKKNGKKIVHYLAERPLIFVSIFIVRCYQWIISPLFPQTCRFSPTCSEYSIQSIRKHGFFRGVVKSLHRLSKCHPFHEGGYDPV